MIMQFYKFNQNNSGGSFDLTDDLTHLVFIEASDEDATIHKFEQIGGYFNGVEDGVDCECCGDRWYYPSLLKEGTPKDYMAELKGYLNWMPKGKEGIIHYADGTKEWLA